MADALGRYHRQMLLAPVGEAGQRALLGSHALIVGCGALGCASAELLARAGVGALTIVDRDVVELTNLQRQCLFDERDAAEALPKAVAAERRLKAINSQVRVRALVEDFTHRNAVRVAGGGDGFGRAAVILDGTDNFETRYLLNDLSVSMGLPYLYAGVIGATGMQATFIPPPAGRGPCLRCLFENPPAPGVAPTCDTAGVLGAAVQIVAALQAADAIKILLGRGDLLSPSLASIDAWSGRLSRIDISSSRNADCPCCSRRLTPFLSGESAGDASVLCGLGAVQVRPSSSVQRGAAEVLRVVKERLVPHGSPVVNEFLVRCTLAGEKGDVATEPIELIVFADGRAIVKGTRSVERARTIYARYVGV